MNKYKFVAELERLLSFMSSWDRQAAIEKYTAMFDEAEDVDVLIAKLGSPTKLAISLAREYVPTEPPRAEEPSPVEEVPAPEEAAPGEEAASGETQEETAPAGEDSPAENPVVISFEEPEEVPVPVPAAEEEPEAGEPAVPGRKARPVALVFYTLVSLVIGLPIAVLLIALGVPVLAGGVGVIAAAVWAAAEVIGFLTMISDILLVAGVAAVAAAIGLLLAWLGLWISLELGYIWIGRVIFGLGGKLCFKKEVAGE